MGRLPLAAAALAWDPSLTRSRWALWSRPAGRQGERLLKPGCGTCLVQGRRGSRGRTEHAQGASALQRRPAEPQLVESGRGETLLLCCRYDLCRRPVNAVSRVRRGLPQLLGEHCGVLAVDTPLFSTSGRVRRVLVPSQKPLVSQGRQHDGGECGFQEWFTR